MSLNFISTACMVNSQINRNQNLNLVVSGQCKFSFSMFNGSLSSFSLTFILFNVQESPFNMLVFIPSWNISAVLHIFFLIIPPLSSAQGYGCHSGFWNIFLEPYRFLSRPPSVSLFHLKSRPYPFQTSYFLRGKTLSSAPHQPNSCLSLISHLSFTQGYHDASQPPCFPFRILFQKSIFFLNLLWLTIATFCPLPKQKMQCKENMWNSLFEHLVLSVNLKSFSISLHEGMSVTLIECVGSYVSVSC